jgi:enoyl-CoA hydratase
MSADHLQVEAKDEVLRVCINRPEKRNALSRDVLRSIAAAFSNHAGDESLKAAVVTGAGDKSFAAGGDLKDLASIRTLDEAAKMADDAKAALHEIRRFPVPVIAALNGDAMGGGAELAMACDFRVAASHARIGFVQGRLNVSTAWGGGIDLMYLVGPHAALRILCRSELFTPEQALALGLIDASAESGQALADRVTEFLAPLLRQVPQVLRGFKGLAHGVRSGYSRAELDSLETRLFARTWIHDDHWAAAETILSKSRE